MAFFLGDDRDTRRRDYLSSEIAPPSDIPIPRLRINVSTLELRIPLRTLVPCASSQPRSQRLDNPITNQRKHDGLYSQILEDRQKNGQESGPYDEFYGSDEVENVAIKGFPSIGAFHAHYPNTRVCRSFAALTQRLMTIYQCQLTCLQGALADLDAEGAIKSDVPGEKGSQPAPFDKAKFISRCLRSPDQKSLVHVSTREEGREEGDEQKKERIEAERENLIANIEHIFEQLRSLVGWQDNLRKFPQVSFDTHERLFKFIKGMDGLDPDAIDYLRTHDDFFYADADPLYQRFHTFLVYIRGAFIRSVKYLSCKTLFADEDVSFGTGAYNDLTIRLFVKFQMVLGASALVLVPVGILYLGETGKGNSFLVVSLFGFAFAFTLIAFDNRMGHVLLGLAAYYAVLVSFFNIAN
ncbi:hypothetical protein F4859DRAFT_483193 [Xylaria cf. heliscus]|nr:hypothetical protein F4859DRAFT_483193 [Xylaria cf. heliscus]